MAADMSVLGLIPFYSTYLRSAKARFLLAIIASAVSGGVQNLDLFFSLVVIKLKTL